MSSNQNNTEQKSLKRSLEVEPADTNDTCSLQDAINFDKERTEIANAVLGASDATNCSYKDGYVYRQALYCCLTCLKEKKLKLTPEESNDFLHGICLACSYECHANHELLELYTKRNFRCDCGNSKFTDSVKCKLINDKELKNDSNKYNHNFDGLYCICNKPYPEPESDSFAESKTDTDENKPENEENSDEMIQCTICEDWYHFNHLTGNEEIPENEEAYEEMICQGCMKSNHFLWNYQGYIGLKPAEKKTDSALENEILDAENINISNCSDKQTPTTKAPNECSLKNNELKNKDLNIVNLDKACCFLTGWRQALCKCLECLELYKKNGVEFLLNKKDTITYYEALGKAKEPLSELDENKLIDDQLNTLNRVSRVEFLHGVNDFKTELTDFLTGFASKGEVVKRENIEEFFAQLEDRKRRKLEDDNRNNVANFYCQ